MFRLSLLVFAVALGTSMSLPYYKPLSKEAAARLASWNRTKEQQNIWQLSGQYQGDMILRPSQIRLIDTSYTFDEIFHELDSIFDTAMFNLLQGTVKRSSRQYQSDMILDPGRRNGVTNTGLRWPHNEIPYELDPIFGQDQANQIHEAVKAFAATSCVTVRPRTDADVDYVYVTGDNSGCWSYVGRLGGKQYLNLQLSDCLWDGLIVHEFLHAVGFYHEQSSTERDDYVTIMWQNVMPGQEYNFDKYGEDMITNFGEPYDYDSVMHYDAWASTSNGEPTIIPNDPSKFEVIGRATQMSHIDTNKLNLMYCYNRPVQTQFW